MSNLPPKPENITWVSPYIMVNNIDTSTAFYQKAFGFKVRDIAHNQDGISWHAEMTYKDQVLMFGREGMHDAKSATCPASSKVDSPISMYLYCENVDKFHDAAVSAGAISVGKPEDMFWGDRICRLKDQDGYVWCFATNVKQHQK